MTGPSATHEDAAWLARNGRLCCPKHDTWCALINLEDGSCTVEDCPVERRAERMAEDDS